MKPRSSTFPRACRTRWERGGARAYTLVEILLVIAIMAVILAIGIPSVFHNLRKSPMRQAVSDLQEACQTARVTAILRGAPAEVVISAQDGSLSVRPAAQDREAGVAGGDDDFGGVAAPMPGGAETAGTPSSTPVPTFSARLPESVAFKKLVVNLRDMMEYDQARIRFYPNGTCDAFAATLLSEQNEERSITLEITTARDRVEVLR
jgi:prepilin-type N-terminal cleavage/methylation domain-containing protein